MQNEYDTNQVQRRTPGYSPKLLMALGMIAVSYFGWMSNQQVNPVTGEKQHLSMTVDQEIALGLQAAPEMTKEYGGAAISGPEAELVESVGNELVSKSDASRSSYKFQFHLLKDSETINAFALPGGQVFMTYGLLKRLNKESEVAAVLGHEIAHVVGRHGAEQMAKTQLIQGITGAAVMATYDPNNPSSQGAAAMATMVGNLLNLKYGRGDESEADRLGMTYMVQAGYDPRGMLGVMTVLKEAMKGNKQPEMMSSHPDPGNRLEAGKAQIEQMFPNGVPTNLKK